MEKLPQFRLLGPFEVTGPSGSPVDFGHRKAAALLAYLAVEHARPQHREHLASLLWARTGEERARHNLRQAMSKLRVLCADLLETPGDGVRINPEHCVIDLIQFERLARADDAAELAQALDLYRGDLLDGYNTNESAYQDWLDLTRARLRKRACDVASRLANLLQKEHRNGDAIAVLHRWLRMDRASEAAHRDLMRLLAESGQRSEALRQYQECAAALAQELGVEPGAETQALRDAIGQNVEARTAAQPMPVAESQIGVVLAVAGAGQDMDLDAQLSQFQGQALSRGNELLLARFPGEEQAVACAVELLAVSGGSVRIGIHQGAFIHLTEGPTGDAVSVAVRLLALAETGSVCVSEKVRYATRHSVRGEYQFIGEHRARDLEQPFLAFRLSSPGQLGVGGAPHCAAGNELPLPGKPSIIIKPFVSMSAEGDQDYFAEGLTKDISIALTKIPGLFLAEDATPKAHKAVSMRPTDLGRAFGVRYVLDGGVRKAGTRVRVNAELIDVTTSQCVWGERYDCELHDLFEVQDQITEEIVTAMDVKLVQGEAARFMRKALTNPAALEASYRGWYALYHGTGKQDVFEAQRLFGEVVRLQPESPLGYASAALAYWAEAGFGRIRLNSPAMAHAVALARKALELGDTTGYAHLVLAVEHLAQHHYDQAMAQATEGVAARPNCNGAYAIKSMVLNFLGQPQEAIEFAQYAVRLTPFYPAEYPAVLAASYHDSGRFEEAVAAAEASLQLKKNDIDPMLFLAASQAALGNMTRARAVAQDVLRLDPGFRTTEFAETQPYKNLDDLDRLIGRLRACGLPD